MNKISKLSLLISLFFTLSCNQYDVDSSSFGSEEISNPSSEQFHSLTSEESSKSYVIKYEEDFYVFSKDYFEKDFYNDYKELSSIKLSLYHQNPDRSIDKTPYSFPSELINMIEEPLLPLTKIRIYYNDYGNIIGYSIVQNANHYFVKAIVVPKNEEEIQLSEYNPTYFKYGRDSFAFDNSFNLIEKYDDFYYQSIADLDFKFSISDNEEINTLFNLSMVFDYVIKDTAGSVIKVNELSLGDSIYVLMYPANYPTYIYSFNPFDVSTVPMLDQGDNIYCPY